MKRARTIEIFETVPCRECGRAVEEFSHCPWCGAWVSASRRLVWNVVTLTAVFILAVAAFGMRGRSSPALLYAVAAISGFVLASSAGRSGRRVALAVALAAVAVSGLCHAVPEEAVFVARRLRFHLGWIVPCTALVLAAGSIRLPPLPPEGLGWKMLAALKTPLAVLLAGAAAEVALLAPANALSMMALAFWCSLTMHANGWTAALVVVAAVLPAKGFAEAGSVAGAFALGAILAPST